MSGLDLIGRVDYEPILHDRRPDQVERLAAKLAWERGGQTHPLSDYDLDRAHEQITGQKLLSAENTRLRKRVAELERALRARSADSLSGGLVS